MEKVKFMRKTVVGDFEQANLDGAGVLSGRGIDIKVGDEFEVTIRGRVTSVRENHYTNTTRFSYEKVD